MTNDDEPVEHGVEGAYYDNLAKLAFHSGGQIMECLCGYRTSGWYDSWEQAGSDLDDHLLTVRGDA